MELKEIQADDELYTFLLRQERTGDAESLQQSDSEVMIPDPRYTYKISPNPMKIYFLSLFAGFGLPFLVIFLNFLFDNRLKYEDIKRLTQLPILGNMPHNTDRTNRVVFENPNSALTESYRLLRARMQFLTKEAKAPVFLVTSSIRVRERLSPQLTWPQFTACLAKKP